MTARYAGGLSRDHGDWYTRAQCRTADPRLFDGDRWPGETIDARNARLKDTRRYYCDQCPVTAECAEAAWRHNDYGTLRAGRTRMTKRTLGVPAHKLSQIRSLAARRHTDREIGAVIGWHPETVRRARERYGIPAGQPAHRPRRAS